MNILRLSNFLNEGTKNGKKCCLNFDSILRLIKIKGKNNKSLLYYAI